VDLLVKRAVQRVVVIEAIKLLESDLRGACDAIWVTYAPEEIQISRLMRKRNLSREEALQRMRVQPPQSEKVAAANTVIRNTGSYDELWRQVSAAWKQASPATDTGPVILKKAAAGEFTVQRGRPRDSASIAELITRLSKSRQKMTADEVMAAFGDKAFLLLQLESERVGLAGWQVENLVSRTTDLYLDPEADPNKALEALLHAVESAAQDLQCEASLAFPYADLAGHEAVWKRLGYERRTPETLGVQAWQDAATESMLPGTTLFFKRLRQDRVLRPI